MPIRQRNKILESSNNHIAPGVLYVAPGCLSLSLGPYYTASNHRIRRKSFSKPSNILVDFGLFECPTANGWWLGSGRSHLDLSPTECPATKNDGWQDESHPYAACLKQTGPETNRPKFDTPTQCDGDRCFEHNCNAHNRNSPTGIDMSLSTI